MSRFFPLRRAAWTAAARLASPSSPFFGPLSLLRGHRPTFSPLPTVSSARCRVLIAPANFSEQGFRFARALEVADSDIVATSAAITDVSPLNFEVDVPIEYGAFHLSRQWQEAWFNFVCSHTHILIEAGKPLFGRRFRHDPLAEAQYLHSQGIKVAFLLHGSESRDPQSHAQRYPNSPFSRENVSFSLLNQRAAAFRNALKHADFPIFATTPDLLEDVPQATWAPLIVDTQWWAQLNPQRSQIPSTPLSITHIPSKAWMKGTDLVQEAIKDLSNDPRLRVSIQGNLSRLEMRAHLSASDIVLEQFRLGSYGAAAVEAMATGALTIGWVTPSVRSHIKKETGLPLPIVDAHGSEEITTHLRSFAANPDRIKSIQEESAAFAQAVHSGGLTASILLEHWINA